MNFGRGILGLVALGGILVMAGALYMEHVMGLVPCPLCMLQRGALALVILVALAGFIHGAGTLGEQFYGLGLFLTAALGAGLAGRQLWLQSLPPDQVPACGPSFDYLVEALPLFDVIMTALQGTGDCAKVVWQFLGLSIPGWSLVAFVGIGLLGVWLFVRPLLPIRL